MEKTQAIFKALSDETRLSIVLFLRDVKKASCKDISEKFPELSQPTMSLHFKILKESGVLDVKKKGTEHTYTLNIQDLKKCGIDVVKL